MSDLPNPVDYAVPAFVVLVLAEMIVARLKNRARYEPMDTLTSLLFGFGSSVAGLLTGGLLFGLAVWIYQYRLIDIPFVWWACPLVLGEPRQSSQQPALQSVDGAAADMDGIFCGIVPVPPAAVPDRLSPCDGAVLRRTEPHLSILDSHRSDRPLPALVRGRDEHAVAPPCASCDQPALS
jgi:hypothetical protein